MSEAIQRCDLDLRGSVILTEAAIGSYVVTPIIAAMAGAELVYALTRATRYGSVDQVTAFTREVADRAGVGRRVRIVLDKSAEVMAEADIITNSGHVRPIDSAAVDCFKQTAVVPLMYESWEYRPGDVDLIACRAKGVPVAGTNERHRAVDVFSYLGIMAVKLLLDAGIAVHGSRILLLCDNPFSEFIENGLSGAGALVDCARSLSAARNDGTYDAILIALRPGPRPLLGRADAKYVKETWSGTAVVQFWGDIQRASFAEYAVPMWPPKEPGPGHMGVLPSDIGPEPVVRLQSGGLKVGELLWRARRAGHASDQAVQVAVESGFADKVTPTVSHHETPGGK